VNKEPKVCMKISEEIIKLHFGVKTVLFDDTRSKRWKFDDH